MTRPRDIRNAQPLSLATRNMLAVILHAHEPDLRKAGYTAEAVYAAECDLTDQAVDPGIASALLRDEESGHLDYAAEYSRPPLPDPNPLLGQTPNDEPAIPLVPAATDDAIALLTELLNHEENRNGPWTSGMKHRVRATINAAEHPPSTCTCSTIGPHPDCPRHGMYAALTAAGPAEFPPPAVVPAGDDRAHDPATVAELERLPERLLDALRKEDFQVPYAARASGIRSADEPWTDADRAALREADEQTNTMNLAAARRVLQLIGVLAV